VAAEQQQQQLKAWRSQPHTMTSSPAEPADAGNASRLTGADTLRT